MPKNITNHGKVRIKERVNFNVRAESLRHQVLKNGKVTPVTGISPTTTIKLRLAWIIRPKERPNAKYLPNKSVCFKEIVIPR